MKGNRFAQKTLAELVRNVEEEDRKAQLDDLAAAIKYKDDWARAVAHYRKAGTPEPTPVSHPDDMIIDIRAGTVRIAGPASEEEKQKLDAALARRAEAQEIVNSCAEDYRKSRSRRMKEMYLEEWHSEQLMFDLINDHMPKRYKVELNNRSYRENSTQPGMTTEVVAEWRDEKLKRRKR